MNQEKCCTIHTNHDEHVYNNTQHIIKSLWIAGISFIILISGIFLEHFKVDFFQNILVQYLWYGIPLIFVGVPVFKNALELALNKDFFNELSLMSLATIGAFIIGESAEGLGIMVFYTIGEIVQDFAVSKSKNNIKSLLDVRPDIAHLISDHSIVDIAPKDVKIGDIIEVYTGEKIPLDGILLTEEAFFNTAALTGESVPRRIVKSEEVLAGMLSCDQTIKVQVTKLYQDSTLARILQMVQDAVTHKSKTELFIRKFARIYTPIVFLLSILVTIVPFFVLGNDYILKDWIYRSLVFLVLSCPCALVISVPLGYFGGIGLASANGILFKGSNYLEAMTNLKYLATDKTGTLTKGTFTIQKVIAEDESKLFSYLLSIEKHSTHPIAKAIVEYIIKKEIPALPLNNVKNVAGRGLSAKYLDQEIYVGSSQFMLDNGIVIPKEYLLFKETVVFLSIDQQLIGLVTIADEIKEDTAIAIQKLHDLGVEVSMLSGDKEEIVQDLAKKINIDKAYGNLLPQGKADYMIQLKAQKQKNEIIAFVGDGINDAPVLALSDVGIAMGGLGSDLAIETADIIIQTDEPSKIPLAISIAKDTKAIVIQNIIFAMLVKIIVLILGIYGLSSIWEAIFADVGVSLLAICNSSRLLYRKYK